MSKNIFLCPQNTQIGLECNFLDVSSTSIYCSSNCINPPRTKNDTHQWTDGKSLRRLLSSVFMKGTRSKQISDSTAKPLPTVNAVLVSEAPQTATTSTSVNQGSSRGETSSISTFGSGLMRRKRGSRISPSADSPLRREPLSPSSVVLTDATSLSSPHQQNLKKCRTCSYELPTSIIDQGDPPERAPLTARYPEIFTYMRRNGVPNSALALTNDIVRNLNEIFYREGQFNDHKRIVNRLDDEYECVEMTLNELNHLLPSSGSTVQSDRDAKLEELKYLSNVSSRIQEQKRELQEATEREYGELKFSIEPILSHADFTTRTSTQSTSNIHPQRRSSRTDRKRTTRSRGSYERHGISLRSDASTAR
ncbi:hypothetical protein BofuT4_P106100.1 [Botrytis cinerea T4]|uniref:Uncharacterized protein n=1 Tax=Botryotinia fuckeliana (strain T4) TaxID=999810 RepID=G2Y8G3_BOTF4|nr:hypothetical protein BofuT4_P106100.1 [Botrytis cinerea T4]